MKVTQMMKITCSPWSYGKCLLIVDAAHSMNPVIGQGLNCVVKDCEIIDDLIEIYGFQMEEVFKVC